MIAIIMLYAVSASTVMISKWLLVYVTPIFLTGVRTLIAGMIFLLYVCMRKRMYVLSSYIKPCLLIGCASFYMSNNLKFYALQTLSNSQATAIALVEPLFAVLFAYILCNERMPAERWFGLLLCMLGAYSGSMTSLPSCSWGACLLLASVIASSYGALLMRNMMLKHHDAASIINGLSMFGAGLCACATSLISEQPFYDMASIPMPLFIGILLFMVGISNIYAYSLYGTLVKRYSAVLISSASLLRPFFSELYSGLVTYQMVASSLLIMCGLVMLYRQECEQQEQVSWIA